MGGSLLSIPDVTDKLLPTLCRFCRDVPETGLACRTSLRMVCPTCNDVPAVERCARNQTDLLTMCPLSNDVSGNND